MNSPRASCSAFSNRPKIPSNIWTQVCKCYRLSPGRIGPSASLQAQLRRRFNADLLGARESKDIAQLSSLGHFLKGSSATLGLTKVKDACEKIQHFGAYKDETGTTEVPDKELCLERIKKTMIPLKRDYAEAETILKRYYQST